MDEFVRAGEFLDAGRADLAEALIRRGLERSPGSGGGHALLSLTFTLTGRRREAKAEAAEALRCAPNDAFAYYVQGCALLEAGNVSEAEAAAEQALKIAPLHWPHAHLLARIRFAQKRFQACRALVESAWAGILRIRG